MAGKFVFTKTILFMKKFLGCMLIVSCLSFCAASAIAKDVGKKHQAAIEQSHLSAIATPVATMPEPIVLQNDIAPVSVNVFAHAATATEPHTVPRQAATHNKRMRVNGYGINSLVFIAHEDPGLIG